MPVRLALAMRPTTAKVCNPSQFLFSFLSQRVEKLPLKCYYLQSIWIFRNIHVYAKSRESNTDADGRQHDQQIARYHSQIHKE